MTRMRPRLLATLLGLSASWSAAGEPVVLTGERIEGAALVAYDSSAARRSIRLLVDEIEREAEGLVRWGEPRPPRRRPALVFADGSWLLSDRTWSIGGLVRIDAEQVKLRRGAGWVAFDRDTVRWVVLDADVAGRRIETLDLTPSDDDTALLVGGDQLTGRVASLDRKTLKFESAGEPLETTPDTIAAIKLAGSGESFPEPSCLIGFRDGSLFRAERLTVSSEGFTATLQGAEFAGRASTLSLVQPLDSGVTYLSDLEPIDYRHTPYFDLAWPFTRDRGLRGGLLAGGGVRRAKGLATHSAARLIYRLDGDTQRFRATLAIADPPAESATAGSVVFRVYLVKGGAFEPAYESPIVRAGDPAASIDLDCAGAAALALVVDYADGGDAGDEALWLDARLVRTEP
ncbi:NPCBM/NEW2 domain protein [Planctomycetes bacterium MalM25]|nr:NPCBM/NEW2 domain protein [Planctomycetes bacterium MalM25]